MSTHTTARRGGSPFRSMVVAGVAIAIAVGITGCAPSEAEAEADAPVSIFLTRHGETMLNTLDRTQGWSDSPLTAEGEEQAESLGKGLAAAGVGFEAAYSADMLRHWQTASDALSALESDLDVTRDERFREISFGKYEGGSGDELWGALAEANGYADLEAMWMDPEFSMTKIMSALPAMSADSGVTAEDPATVAERAIAGLEDIAKEHTPGGGEVLVVSSGLTIYFVLEALGADLSEVTEGIGNGTVSELSYSDGEWTVESVNDSSYVDGAAH